MEDINQISKQDNEKYVFRLMRAKCSCGTMENYLNVKKDHGVLANDDMQPLLNANDHTKKNVIHFGNCTSDKNTSSMIRKGLVKSVFGPAGFLIGDFVDAVADTVVDGIGTKCKPKTPKPWVDTNEDFVLDGAPALMVKSKLTCRYGGVISIVLPVPEEAEDSSEDTTQSDEETVTDIAQESVNAALNDALEKIQETGEIDAATQENVQATLALTSALPPVGNTNTNNIAHNSKQSLEGALNSEGHIKNIEKLSNFKINNSTVDKEGSGAVSVYNTIKELNPESPPPNFANIINDMEKYGVTKTPVGNVQNGVAHYLYSEGYNVSMEMNNENMPKDIKWTKNILLQATDKGVGYVDIFKKAEEIIIGEVEIQVSKNN